MDARALTVLEFPKIRERLAERTAFAASRGLALDLEPSAGRRAIETGLNETSEARLLLELQADFSVRAAHDVRPVVQRALVGAVLDPPALQEVRDTLESALYVRGVLTRLADRLPLLAGRAETLDPCPIVSRAIKESIGERGDILDSASPELARVRAQQRTAYNRLMDALQRIISSSGARTMLQEALITSRNGRYVVPVRAEARNQFRGIVHDESSSGQTVFMEPLATVELNNEWRHLQLEEEKEIERVLQHLSGLVGQFGERIGYDVEALAAIDLAVAKARYALDLRATAPRLETGYRLNLRQARHPLLSGDVVPIDVALGQVVAPGERDEAGGPGERDDTEGTGGTGRPGRPGAGEEPVPQAGTPKDFIALVITGPNTGGKTVALKTVGLLQLMAQAGMHLPVTEGSSVAVFEQVFADIGDEQSIEQSLSTFSSHMSNIVRILERVDGGCLVLLDELGAGTDPEEGSALARAILSYLVARDVRTVATTHYSELKAYAYSTPLVQNASVEFDVETLRPTYRLITGLPGRSNALAIAQRLGLPRPILDGARSMVRAEEAQIEDLLAGIQAERDAAQAARQEADRLREVAQTAQTAAERRLDEIEEERISLLEGARREAAGELETARQQIRRAEGRVAAAGGDRMEVLRATREVQDAAEALAAQPVPRRRGPAPARAPDERPIEVGDRVELRRLNAVGQVLSGPNVRGEVEVQLGNLRTRANVRELTRVTRREADALQTAAARGPAGAPRGAVGWGGVPEGRSSRSEPAVRLPAPRDVRLEIDVRGSRADEVLPRVEQYLSDAYLSGMPFVRVIHGKGTGVLRQIIRDHLAQSQLVQSYESAGPSDGGDGATIVKLAV